MLPQQTQYAFFMIMAFSALVGRLTGRSTAVVKVASHAVDIAAVQRIFQAWE